MTGIRQTYPWNRVIPPFRNRPLKKRSKRVKIRNQVLKKSHQVEVIDLFRDIILQIRILNAFFCKELKFPSGSLLSMHHKVTTIVHASNCFLNLSFSEGRRHDAAMLAESGLLQDLQHHAVSPHGHLMCLYGDPAYPHRVQLQQPFRNAVLTPQMQEYNARMSSVRESVEWLFGDIVNYFKFIDFKKNLKIGLSSIGKMYIVCAILRNALTCLYGNETSKFFELDPPSLHDYFA